MDPLNKIKELLTEKTQEEKLIDNILLAWVFMLFVMFSINMFLHLGFKWYTVIGAWYAVQILTINTIYLVFIVLKKK